MTVSAVKMLLKIIYFFFKNSFQGKTSLDIANLRGDTPLKMLQVNSGQIWIGQKVMERIKEESHFSQKRNFLVKLTSDKVIKLISLLDNFANAFSILFLRSEFDGTQWCHCHS